MEGKVGVTDMAYTLYKITATSWAWDVVMTPSNFCPMTFLYLSLALFLALSVLRKTFPATANNSNWRERIKKIMIQKSFYETEREKMKY